MCEPSLGINSYCSLNPQLEAAGRLQSCQRLRAGASLLCPASNCECVLINLNVAVYIVVYISVAASSFVMSSWEFDQPPLKLYFEMKAFIVLPACGMCACVCTIF